MMVSTAANPRERQRVHILGVPVDCVTMEQTLDILDQYVASGDPHLIVTADASGIAQAQEDRELFDLYQRAALVTPDSQGVIWAAKRQGVSLPERVSGVEILANICQRSGEKGYRIYFLGAAPGVAEEAASNLRSKNPGCNIVGTRDGYFPSSQDAVVAEEVGRTNPDFLFVAMGIPRQEKFILANQHLLKAKVAIGVGGSLDVMSGRVKRAPEWVQKVKLEWLWRTVSNPKKIRKAMMLPKFVAYVLRGSKP